MLWNLFPTWDDAHYGRYFQEIMLASQAGALLRPHLPQLVICEGPPGGIRNQAWPVPHRHDIG